MEAKPPGAPTAHPSSEAALEATAGPEGPHVESLRHTASPRQSSSEAHALTHAPARHSAPVAQSAAVAQLVLHSDSPHAYGAHAIVWGALHAPVAHEEAVDM